MSEVDSIFLHGVVLANYRGIGSEPIKIGPFQRFNFMIGPNNAGKSCVLRFIAHHLKPHVVQNNRPKPESSVELEPLDIHSGSSRRQVRMGFSISTHKAIELAWVKIENHASDIPLKAAVTNLLDAISEKGLIWLERGNTRELCLWSGEINPASYSGVLRPNAWGQLEQALIQRGSRELLECVENVMNSLLQTMIIYLPTINMIPAIREISPRGQAFDDWSGAGLIEELARLQNPKDLGPNRLEKFERINIFLQTVTESKRAKIEIPHDREHVMVHMDDKLLPLESLGTGIHEVVMLAAFCTLMENQIVCIEEPEIHLHPLLQRRLMQYLHDKTSNQYFIATHSPAFIDTPNSAVFHVTNHEGKTQINLALTPNSRFDICRDLGYKASDLLQANAIVWVEGPSDRIYLRHWIAALAPDLREGIDYSIMFYGGRLLSHLSADDLVASSSDINALIACRQLNRNLAVLIDSDRDKQDKPINATKARIVDELATGGVAWVTAGREIENYVSEDLMTLALQESYPKRFGKRHKKGRYEHVLPFKDTAGKIVNEVDKVKVAKAICGKPADLDLLDLRERITELVALIQKANR